MIPKIIHYCWYGRGKYDATIEKCIESWKQICPDWEFRLWNEENSPMEIPWCKETYKYQKYAFVADYVRFYALYKFGGVYLDTDMLLLKSLEPFLGHEVFMGREDAETASMGIIGAEKGHCFMRECMAYYESANFDLMAPPIPVTRIISKQLHQAGFVEENVSQLLENGVFVYKSDYFYPIHYTDKYDLDTMDQFYTDNTVSVHLWNNSWRNEFQYLAAKEWKTGFGKAWNRIKRNPILPIKYYLRLLKYMFYWIVRKR